MTFKKQIISGSVSRRMLAVAIGLGLGCSIIPVQAQVITGTLAGTVPQGKEVTVQISNEATGLRRVLTPSDSGKYSTAGLAPGNYQVTILYHGKAVATRTVAVRPNITATAAPVVDLKAANPAPIIAQRLSAITVNASAANSTFTPIDVTTPELISSYSMALINQLPVGRSPESIAVLQSNVHQDSATTGSIYSGGATAAGNRFFLNGFDITNDVTSIGGRSIPPDAIENTSVIPGNASASWTTSTGGVLASTLRQGTNQFKGGYSLYFTPPTSRLLEPRGHNVIAPNGTYYNFSSENSHGANIDQDVWASGALIKDKLFFFGLIGNQPPISKSRNVGYQYTNQVSNRNRNYLLNLTWNITNNQSLNLFGSKTYSSTSTNSYILSQPYNLGSNTTYSGNNLYIDNDKYLIANYDYNITPDLNLELTGGYLSQTFGTVADEQGRKFPYVSVYDDKTQQYTNIGPTLVNGNNPPETARKRAFGARLTWNVGPNKIGFGGGLDKHFNTRLYGSNPNGNWTYYSNRPGYILGNGFEAPASGKYVDDGLSLNGGTLPTSHHYGYLQDYFSVASRWTLYGALRYDGYNYKNTQSKSFSKLHLLSPRLGVAWDVHGDSTLKIGANIGKYGVPLPSNYSFGVAHQSLVYDKYFTYTGIDPTTKLPTGAKQIGPTYYQAFGNSPAADTISSTNLKSSSVVEFNLYAQMQFTRSWSGLANATYSRGLSTVNEYCDMAIVDQYAHTHGFPNYDSNGMYSSNTGSCIEFNPGRDLSIRGRGFSGLGADQKTLVVPASVLGIQGPKRKFYSFTFQLNHQRTSEEPYFLNFSYTWTHEYGNYDGLLNMDRRNGGYIGETRFFAYPELQKGSSGNISQDIPNNFVASGVYYFPDGFNVGAVLNAHSGTPLSCYGTYIADPNSFVSMHQGAVSHFCNGNLVPVGSAGRTPFFWSVNVSAGYDWHISDRNDLNLQLQVFNVTNRAGVIDRNQTFDQGYIPSAGALPPLSTDYGLPRYQGPRTVSLNVRYTF